MLQEPDGLVYGLAGGQIARHVTGEARGHSPATARVLRLRVGIMRGSGAGSVQAPQLLLLLLLLLRQDSLLLGEESWLVVTQRGGSWDDIL